MPLLTEIPLARYPVLARHAQFADFSFALEAPGERKVAQVRGGQALWSHDADAPCTFTFRASAAAWQEFSRPLPRPGFHDLFALVEGGHAHASGNLLPFFRHLMLVKLVAAAMCGREWT